MTTPSSTSTAPSRCAKTPPEIHNNRGLALARLSRHEEARDAFDKAIALNPDFIHAHNNLGHVYMAQSMMEEAIACFKRALEIDRDFAIASMNLGLTYHQMGELTEARKWFDDALRIDPGMSGAYNGIGIVLQEQNRHEEAAASFHKAVEMQPYFSEALNNLAISMQGLGRVQEAIHYYREVLVHAPERSEVYFNLGSLLHSIARYDESIVIFNQALLVRPDNQDIYPYLAHSLMQTCAWSNLEAVTAKVIENVENEVGKGSHISVSPFRLQGMPASMKLRHKVARHVSSKAAVKVSDIRKSLHFEHKPRRGKKLKVGYVSPDFRFHSVGVAFRGVLQAHDRERVETYGYSIANLIGHDDKIAPLFPDDFEHFIDAAQMPHNELAERIYDDGVDVLVDLAGHTRGNRLAIFALRPAPVQAHWLGFSTTTGAEYLDYLISDRHFMPHEFEEHCTEKLLYMPESFMATTRSPISDEPISRADSGLPEDGFVFANFNGQYKMHPHIFSTWMRLLRRVPGSVLWLIECTAATRKNLVREAETRGVSADRLVYAQHLPHDKHLARHRLADLCLDNLYHGGGVTTSDALWAGLPVLTIAGDTPAGRNGATLPHAAELPELVTDSIDSYERLAFELATHPERGRAYRRHLEANRLSLPLFDTERLTRHLEIGYEMMWENWAQGNPPRRLTVPPLPH